MVELRAVFKQPTECLGGVQAALRRCGGDPPGDLSARCRPNTLLASAYDLKVFFSVVPKELADIVTADVFAFIAGTEEAMARPKGPARRR
ncbi:hypothetical protein [Streptomyces sp. NPDC003635]